MPHVSIHYKMYVPAGHHRQPRNANSEIELAPSGEVDVTNPGNVTPPYFAQLPYTLGGGSGFANLIFWSVTDGTNGKVHDASPLTQPVGANPLTITAWYYPISGPGLPGGDAIIDDAFSAAKGDFIDDTFVTVTSNPALTSDANVIGVVPTSSAQTLVAAHSVASTPEPFAKWLSFGAGTAANDTLSVPAKSNGLAIAVYEKPDSVVNPIKDPDSIGVIVGTIIGGVAVDGGGAIIINGKPHPVDPWGPLIAQLIKSALVAVGAKSLADRKLGAQITHLAAQDALGAIKHGAAAFEKQAKAK
jgi:hypothetical protein